MVIDLIHSNRDKIDLSKYRPTSPLCVMYKRVTKISYLDFGKLFNRLRVDYTIKLHKSSISVKIDEG